MRKNKTIAFLYTIAVLLFLLSLIISVSFFGVKFSGDSGKYNLENIKHIEKADKGNLELFIESSYAEGNDGKG